MRSIRRSGVTAVTAAIALALGAVPVVLTVPAIVAGGQSQTIAPASTTGGTLDLSTTSSQGTVSWNGQTQTFTGGQQCKITPTNNYSGLLGITGSVGETPGSAGFKNGAIGVFEFTSDGQAPANASQCFRVDADSFTPSETLTLNLGADVKDTFGALVARSATVTLAAQSQSGTVAVKMLGAGTNSDVVIDPKNWTKLKAGASIALPTLPVGQFDGIELKATAGSFSLKAASFPLLSQADQTFCNPGNPAGSNTRTEDNTTVTYLGNANGSPSCFGVTLTSGPREVQFLKPLTVAPDAQFVFNVAWTLDNADGEPGVTIPNTDIDFELGAANTNALPFCSDFTSIKDSADKFILVRDGANLKLTNYDEFSTNSSFLDFEPASATEKEWGCIDTRSSDVTSAEIVIHDIIFVVGDVKMTIR